MYIHMMYTAYSFCRDSNGATPKDRLKEQGKNYQEILDLLRERHFALEKHIIHVSVCTNLCN